MWMQQDGTTWALHFTTLQHHRQTPEPASTLISRRGYRVNMWGRLRAVATFTIQQASIAVVPNSISLMWVDQWRREWSAEKAMMVKMGPPGSPWRCMHLAPKTTVEGVDRSRRNGRVF
jgi:hypothetical protein